jgi:hypothetical protein
MAKTIILEELYPFFNGYKSENKLVDGKSWTVKVECGCSGEAIPGQSKHRWWITTLCPIHGQSVEDN